MGPVKINLQPKGLSKTSRNSLVPLEERSFTADVNHYQIMTVQLSVMKQK